MERKWWTLIAVCTATFVLLLDITVVNVALPDIARDLGATFTDLQWVIDAYTLTLAALLLMAGSLADQYGRRSMFVARHRDLHRRLGGRAASRPRPLMLNLARAVQGVGGAFMFATGLALLASTFEADERGTAIGIWGAVTGAAVAVGPLIGGALVEWLGWESIFFINLPIGIATLVITFAKVDESKDPSPLRLDWLGTVVFSVALFALIFALIRGNPEGWSSGLIVGMLRGRGRAAGGLRDDRGARAAARRSTSRCSASPSFVGASLAAFVLSASMFSMFLYLGAVPAEHPRLRAAGGRPALPAGDDRGLRWSLRSRGKLAERLGVKWFLGGGLVCVGGRPAADVRGRRRATPGRRCSPGFMIAGLGIGLVNPALATAAIGVVDRAPRRHGLRHQLDVPAGRASRPASRPGARCSSTVADRGSPRAARGPQEGVADFILFGGAAQAGARSRGIAEEAFVAGLDYIVVLAAIVAIAGAVARGGARAAQGLRDRRRPRRPRWRLRSRLTRPIAIAEDAVRD